MKKTLPPQLQKIQQQLDLISAAFKQQMAAGNYSQAALEAEKAHRLIPRSVVPLSDAATTAVKAGEWQQAIDYANKALQRDPNHINSHDALSHAYGALQDWQNCARYGRRALELRDQKIAARPAPALPCIQPDPSGKKIIAFSLFGDQSDYIEPAVINAQIAAEIYPGWTCRFYIDSSVPKSAVERLAECQAEVIPVTERQQKWPGTLWRFLALDDPQAAYVIFRDADSVISAREAKIVAEWIQSGQYFHTIRDAGTHTELMLAGLWGAVGGVVPDIEQKICQYLSQPLESRHFADQFFLRDHIWAYARQSLCAHDRLFGFQNARPIPTSAQHDHRFQHIGCDEGSAHFQTQYPLPDGSAVVWKLYTKISPMLDDQGNIIIQPQERLVCQYRTLVRNGQISGSIPRRYSKGFANGASRMMVARADD